MVVSRKTALRLGFLFLLSGCVIAVATWPQSQAVALEGTHYPSHVTADLGLAAAMVGLVLVLGATTAYGMGRLRQVDQENKP